MTALALSNEQLRDVMRACAPLDPAKRAVLMERVAAQLRLNGGNYFSDDDVARALKIALAGLQHEPAA